MRLTWKKGESMIASKRYCLIAVALLLSVTPSSIYAQNYAKEMRNLFKDSLKVDYKKYQFFAIPMDSFGVGFMYPKAAKSKDFDIKTEGLYGNPNNWWVDTLSDDQKKKETALIFTVGQSGKIDVKSKKTKSLSLSATLPALYKLVTASGGVDWDKTTTVTFSADTVQNDIILWPELDDAVNGNSQSVPAKPVLIKSSVARHFHSHDYLITVGDIVATKLTAHVAVTKNLDAKAQAQLTTAIANLGKDAKASFEYKSNGDGSFDITSTTPVVVAVYIGEPPEGAVHAFTEKMIPPVLTPALIKQLQDVQTGKMSIPAQ
jgi:hypothetical protein